MPTAPAAAAPTNRERREADDDVADMIGSSHSAGSDTMTIHDPPV